jgi:hypothetical protein
MAMPPCLIRRPTIEIAPPARRRDSATSDCKFKGKPLIRRAYANDLQSSGAVLGFQAFICVSCSIISFFVSSVPES